MDGAPGVPGNASVCSSWITLAQPAGMGPTEDDEGMREFGLVGSRTIESFPATVGRRFLSPPAHPDASLPEFCLRVAAVSGRTPGSTGVEARLPSNKAICDDEPSSTVVDAVAPTF